MKTSQQLSTQVLTNTLFLFLSPYVFFSFFLSLFFFFLVYSCRRHRVKCRDSVKIYLRQFYVLFQLYIFIRNRCYDNISAINNLSLCIHTCSFRNVIWYLPLNLHFLPQYSVVFLNQMVDEGAQNQKSKKPT